MLSKRLNIIRVLYSFIMLFLFLISIKASESLSNNGGIIGSMLWTGESIYYIALVLFVVNALMYQIDKRKKWDYIIVFGFSLIFINFIIFQILGIGLIFIGLIFQLIINKSKL